MRKSVYIETSIPSAYVSLRQDVHSVSWKEFTRQWWQRQKRNFDVFTSQEVLNELAAGDFPGKMEAVRLLESVPQLDIDDDVRAIAEVYVRERLMPGPYGTGDSIHLATASYHQMDFLLTWNIRHLANPSKMEHIVVLNRRLALITPVIVTPDMLWLEA